MGGELVTGKGTLDTLKVGDGYWKGNPGDSEDGMAFGTSVSSFLF